MTKHPWGTCPNCEEALDNHYGIKCYHCGPKPVKTLVIAMPTNCSMSCTGYKHTNQTSTKTHFGLSMLSDGSEVTIVTTKSTSVMTNPTR